MSQKIKTSVEIDGSLKASQIANATTDTDKFLVSDSGTVKYRTGAEVLSDLGITVNTTSKLQHQVKAGVAINKGQAVYVTSADGTNMIVGLASNASEATSSKTMGLLDGTVAINGFANVVTEGLLSGLSITGAVSEGDPVWLGTGGNLIYGLANKPSAPNHLVFIGIVTRVNANNGEIFVKVQNGFELNEIHDVDLKTTLPSGNDILAFEGAPVNLWKNKTIASVLGYTPYNASNPAGYISTYTETDTLASVTARGASTSTLSTFDGGLNIGNAKLRWGGTTSPTLGFPFTGGPNAFWIDVNDGDTGGLAIDNDGTTIYGAGDSGHVFRVIDEDVYQATSNVDASTTFRIQQGQNGGGYVRGNFEITGTLSASGYNKTNWDTAYGWGNHASAGYLTSVTNITGYARSLNGFANQTEYTILDGPANGPVWKVRYDSATANRYIDFGFKDGNGVYSTGLKIYNGDTPTWQGSTLLHAGNYSSYAVPSSRTITINGTSYDLSANRSWTVTASETDTLATVTARGSSTSTALSLNGNVTFFSQLAVENQSTFARLAFNKLTFWDWQGSQDVITIDGGYLEAANSLRAPIFYDSNNTGYYVDPASTSNLNVLSMANKIILGSFPNSVVNNGEAWIGRAADRLAGTMTVQLGGNLDRKFEVVDYGWTTVNFSVNGYGAAEASGSMRAPIFYDSNNTGYYIDGASTSKLNALTLSSLASDDGMIENNTGGYFHLGGWGVGRTAATAVLVNTAYRADIADNATNAGYATSSGSAGYLPTLYSGGQQLNPQTYFNNGIGLRVAMTAKVGYWSDTVWINGYSGGDVPWMCALHTQRNSSPRMYISAQQHTSGSYGTAYEFLTEYNVADYAVTKNTGQDITGIKYFVSNRNTTSDSCPLQAYSNNGSGATMSFHRGGYYAVNFGLDSDNVMRIGGWSAGANRWQLDMSGNMTVAGDVTAYSDIRVKENIKTIDSALDKVLSLRGVTYNRIDSEDKAEKIGVIAQEIQEVLPQVVHEQADGMLGVSYGNITAVLIEAIKEQQTQIEELKELVKQLTK